MNDDYVTQARLRAVARYAAKLHAEGLPFDEAAARANEVAKRFHARVDAIAVAHLN